MKKYTLVCLCECGCDNSEVHHVKAKNVAGTVGKLRKLKDRLRIIAVFEGHHFDCGEHEKYN